MDTSDLIPRYSQVVLDLEQMINAMCLGDRLETERELALRFNVSRETVRKSLRTLAEKGVLESRRGSGTYVLRHVTDRDTPIVDRARSVQNESSVEEHRIGLSVPIIDVPNIAELVRGAEAAAQELGYTIVLAHDLGDPKLQVAQLRELIDQKVEGLIVFLDQDNVADPACVELLCKCRREGRHMVMVDRYIPRLGLPCVLTDTSRGMYEITQHLIMTGHRRFAVLSWGERAGIAGRNRFAGFRNALRDYGLDEEPVLHGEVGYGHPQDESAERIVAQWLTDFNNRLPCDAIVCFIDDMARGAFRALKKAGLRIPEDIAITGFDNLQPDLDHAMGLDLTTVEQPVNRMGRVAVERLVQSIRSRQTNAVVRHTMLAPKLIIRRSCGEDVGETQPLAGGIA